MHNFISPTVPYHPGQVLPQRPGLLEGVLGRGLESLIGYPLKRTVDLFHPEETSQLSAKRIMGPNMLSIKEAAPILGPSLRNGNLACHGTVPYSRAGLREHRDSHRLVPYLPFSVLELRKRAPSTLFLSNGNWWAMREEFASKKMKPGWKLVPIDVNPRELPQANTLFHTLLLYYLARGVQLNQGRLVLCQDLTSDGLQVGIGFFNGKLVVNAI